MMPPRLRPTPRSRSAEAAFTRGALLLSRARAAGAPEVRREASRSAEEALSAAGRENPLLERPIATLLLEVKRVRAR